MNEEIESDEKYVVLIPGGFKPPHKGHYALLMNYANMPNVEKVIVFTGPKAREGITRQMSQQIFDLYGGLSDKVEIIDHENPMRAAYSELGDEDFVNKFSDDVTFSMGCGDKGDDAARAVEFEDWWTVNADKNILNVKIGNIGSCPAEKIEGGGALSASLMRKAIRHNNDEILKAHVPDGVDIEKIKDITKQSISETIFSIIEEVLNEKYEKKSCTKKGDKKGQKGNCVVTTSKGKSCYDDCQTAYAAVELEELRFSDGPGGLVPGPKKCPKCDLKQKDQPCVCGGYMEPHQHQDSEERDFEELEELSSSSGGASTGNSGRSFKGDAEDDILIREYVRGIKIKTKIRTKAN